MIRALIAASHPAATPEQNTAAATAQSNYRLAEAERAFILLEQDIFAAAPSEIWKARVLETWVNGVRVMDGTQPQ